MFTRVSNCLQESAESACIDKCQELESASIYVSEKLATVYNDPKTESAL